MEKYLRTKDGIFEVKFKDLWGNAYDENEKCIMVKGKLRNHYLMKKDIIDQANTIKALCDEFIWDKLIITFNDKTHFSYENDDFVFELDESKLKEGIYGAIWIVDNNEAPTLKSVSRMKNTEGDFELL